MEENVDSIKESSKKDDDLLNKDNVDIESSEDKSTLINKIPMPMRRAKITKIFCKYRIPNIKIAKTIAAGNLWMIFLCSSFTKTPLRF